MRLTKPGEIRFITLAMVTCVLIASLGMVLLCVEVHPFQSHQIQSNGQRLSGQAAAAKGWPAETPHPTPWPAPDSWTRWDSFIQSTYDVRSSNTANPNANGFAMSLARTGWPLPIFETKAMWWDWNDPALTGYESNPPPRISYLNLAADGLALGIPLWAMLFLPVLVLTFSKRRIWARGKRCLTCGYDIRDLPTCPECGRESTYEHARPAT